MYVPWDAGAKKAAVSRPPSAATTAARVAHAGFGPRTTATTLGPPFVSVGSRRIRLLAASDRTGKLAVERLAADIDGIDDVLTGLDGFDAA